MSKTRGAQNLVIVAALAAGATVTATSTVLAQTYTLKYGHVSAPSNDADDHLMGVFMESFLESRSQGRIEVEIYPAGQLGNFREMLEQVQADTLELTSTTIGGIASFMPELQVTDLPYVIRDDLVAEKLMTSGFFDDVRREVLERTGNIRLVGVGNTGSWRNFATTDKEVKRAEDLEGLKIRTISSDLQMQFVSLLGASATPVAWNELYTALSTNVVDGTKNSIGDYIPMGMAEPLNHIILDGHTYIYGFAWMSDAWLKGLPEDLQELVIDAVTHGLAIQTNFNKQFQSIAAQEWLEMGNTIHVPNEEEMAGFLAVRDEMQTWYAEQFGSEWLDKWLAAIDEAEAAVAAERARHLE